MATAQVAPILSAVQAPESAITPIEAYHWLRCKTTAEVPVPNFTVDDLLNLRMGSVVQTAARVSDDVPLRVNGILLGWGRFEVAHDRLAVRIIELA